MSCFTFLRTMLAVGGVVLFLMPAPAEAQIVRRYAGGGVAVRAPFVRVDVGPNGGTSVRAPFVAVDDPGDVHVGWRQRRRLRRHPELAEAEAAAEPLARRQQAQAMRPTLAEPRPFPTMEQLASFDDVTLLQTLRDLSAQLDYSLQRFDKAVRWQRYLALPQDSLGTAGVEPVEIQIEVLEKQLTRYDKVAAGHEFAKIAALSSFAPTHAALRLVVERFSQPGPVMVDPDPFGDNRYDPGPVGEPAENETLPTPPPSPEPRLGQRSILKRLG
jgi:hypothetical protein